ncbi:phage Gp37/Gp68 family protein [Candidatus Bipolaricaulota bacterium]|nr:phage Gp37/Gp68 family protein [Candidatus Bipolaricaulota bacterium]
MSSKSAIEWTDQTWNPVTGCSKVSPGCENCYAERFARRLKAMGNPRYENGFQLTLHHDKIEEPLSWRKPRYVFVNSMSDLFHKEVPREFIQSVFDVIKQAEDHVFQVLTKRARRLARLAPDLSWPENLWIGVSIENQDYVWRVGCLKQVPAETRFLSVEPLIGPIGNLPLKDIDWVIVGGESGPKARLMKEEWVKNIRDQCTKSSTAFFFKQWGGKSSKDNGRTLEGRTWEEMPKGKVELTL